MNATQALARPEIVSMQAYAHAVWLPHLIRLHANEAPWRPAGDQTEAGLNRYPEPQPAGLASRLAEVFGVPDGRLLVTRGSDEAIDLLSRIFLRAGVDAILQCTPTFGMYQVAARIQGAGVVSIPLDRTARWQIDPDRMRAAWRPGIKLVYLCSPNNPTGNLMSPDAVHAVCERLGGKAIVVIDEAYIEWSGTPSFAQFLDRYETLAIVRTLSKAHALAGARCGALLGRPELIALARQVIPPYAIAQPTIEAAMRALAPAALAESRERLNGLLAEREYLAAGLAKARGIDRVWPSDTNFLMIDCADPQRILDKCIAGGFIVRDLRGNPALGSSLRITVSTHEHNQRLLESLEAA
jgi:histidinol-phosphate aminotransferase